MTEMASLTGAKRSPVQLDPRNEGNARNGKGVIGKIGDRYSVVYPQASVIHTPWIFNEYRLLIYSSLR